MVASYVVLVPLGLLPVAPILSPPSLRAPYPLLRLPKDLATGLLDPPPEEPPSPPPSASIRAHSLALDCLVSGVHEPELASAIAPGISPEPVVLPAEIPPHCAPIDPSTGVLPPGLELPVPIPASSPLPELGDGVVSKTELPSLRELAVFCLPTLGIWLSSPLLSLIDTSVVSACLSGRSPAHSRPP